MRSCVWYIVVNHTKKLVVRERDLRLMTYTICNMHSSVPAYGMQYRFNDAQGYMEFKYLFKSMKKIAIVFRDGSVPMNQLPA